MPAPSVLFLASSLRPGSGGVADYCARLCEFLAERGMECHLASWNESRDEVGRPGSGLMRDALFLAGGETGADPSRKGAALRSYLEHHAIEWVSLQFVNFGFAKRGLSRDLPAVFAQAFQGRRCHVFLHELWLGAHRGARLRERWLGHLQKRQLLALLERLRPEEVWTSIELYRRQLAREKVMATALPIFGTVPISTARSDTSLLEKLGSPEQKKTRADYFLVGLFGTIPRDWPFRLLFPRLRRLAGTRRLAFILFGKNGDAEAFRDHIASLPEVALLSLGALDEAAVDATMNSMDLALATTPAEGIFKSSSAVAFLERGVPTIAIHRGLEAAAPPAESGHPSLFLLDDELEKKLAAAAMVRLQKSFLPEVGERYLELFHSAPAGKVQTSERATGLVSVLV